MKVIETKVLYKRKEIIKVKIANENGNCRNKNSITKKTKIILKADYMTYGLKCN